MHFLCTVHFHHKYSLQRAPLIFLKFCSKWMLKISKGPFYIFQHYEIVQILIFCLIIGFLNTYTPLNIFNTIRFFLRLFGTTRLVSNLFLSKPPFKFYKKLKVLQKKIIFSLFCVLRGFRLSDMCFFAVSSWGKSGSRVLVYPFGF